ncbi:SdpI family protein [Clostridium hydrogeniformans]|uniref:SdpI family protein n=1 Tax=Clostridium hydrogeniformans TaxID=349933 RepID=UPI00068ECDD3|nr:SdpI family protein [Clostridium hydrogeniformans]
MFHFLWLVVTELFPILFIFMGWYIRTKHSQYPEFTVGYITEFSTLNNNTWLEGNRFCGEMLELSGILSSMLTLVLYIFKNSLFQYTIYFTAFICLFSVFYTEVHLRRVFHNDGHLKSKY